MEQEWFAHYPWPTKVTFDRGSKFIGQDFQDMIKMIMELNQNLISKKPAGKWHCGESTPGHRQHYKNIRT